MKKNNLTKKERLILFNQYNILSQLATNAGDKHTAKEYENCMTILMYGYKNDYAQLFCGFEDELSESKSKFVWNVLELYRAIYNKVSMMTPQQRQQYSEHKFKFRGFDGNEEADYFAYCKFVVEDMGRYPEIFENGYTDLNSHCNLVDYYSKLLKIWGNAGKPHVLSDEIFSTLMNV